MQLQGLSINLTDLPEPRIFELEKFELNKLAKFLSEHKSKDLVAEFLGKVADNDYTLAEDSAKNKIAENFLARKEFTLFREIIYGRAIKELKEEYPDYKHIHS